VGCLTLGARRSAPISGRTRSGTPPPRRTPVASFGPLAGGLAGASARARCGFNVFELVLEHPFQLDSGSAIEFHRLPRLLYMQFAPSRADTLEANWVLIDEPKDSY
jgi:hypothetical protein